MTDAMEATASPEFKDRNTGLVVFGILGIVVGALWVLMALGMLVGMAGSAATTQRAGAPALLVGMMALGGVMCLVVAVWFIWMGIGSIMARRWARALILISSWLWLITGTTGLIVVGFSKPNTFSPMVESGKMLGSAATVAMAFLLATMFVFYVIVPGILVLFYGSKHVKATCERRDPRIRWTDKCPLPVLALCMMCGLAACFMPLMGFYGWAMPFFGTIITGAAGAVVTLALMALNVYIAWGSYHLRARAWWAAVLLVIFWTTSWGVTFAQGALADYYKKLGFSPQMVESVKPGIPSLYSQWVYVVLWVAFLLYIRRFFAKPADAEH